MNEKSNQETTKSSQPTPEGDESQTHSSSEGSDGDVGNTNTPSTPRNHGLGMLIVSIIMLVVSVIFSWKADSTSEEAIKLNEEGNKALEKANDIAKQANDMLESEFSIKYRYIIDDTLVIESSGSRHFFPRWLMVQGFKSLNSPLTATRYDLSRGVDTSRDGIRIRIHTEFGKQYCSMISTPNQSCDIEDIDHFIVTPMRNGVNMRPQTLVREVQEMRVPNE